MNYAQKLKDPRWQRRRLEVMKRDNFACVVCGRNDKSLTVHHGCYLKDVQPWEHDSYTMWTLCEKCHETIGRVTETLHVCIAKVHPGHLERAATNSSDRSSVHLLAAFMHNLAGSEVHIGNVRESELVGGDK